MKITRARCKSRILFIKCFERLPGYVATIIFKIHNNRARYNAMQLLTLRKVGGRISIAGRLSYKKSSAVYFVEVREGRTKLDSKKSYKKSSYQLHMYVI